MIKKKMLQEIKDISSSAEDKLDMSEQTKEKCNENGNTTKGLIQSRTFKRRKQRRYDKSSPELDELCDSTDAFSAKTDEMVLGDSFDSLVYMGGSGNMCLGAIVERADTAFGEDEIESHSCGTSVPAVDFSTLAYTDGEAHKKLSDHTVRSLKDKYGFPKRSLSFPGGQDKNWNNPPLSRFPLAVLQPDKHIRIPPSYQTLRESLCRPKAVGPRINLTPYFDSCSSRQQTQDEPSSAGHHSFRFKQKQDEVKREDSFHPHFLPSSEKMNLHLPCLPPLCSSDSRPVFRPDSIPSSPDLSFDFLSSSTYTEGSRAPAELSSFHSEAEVELDGAVTAVSCSVMNNLPTLRESCTSRPSWITGSLPRSHSLPSLSHMTPAENETLTRAQSLPDLQFNISCEQFTPDITADEHNETYRFQCSSPGLYQCSVTGLVFHMEQEGDVVYRTVPWNRKLLSQHHKQPAGPLFDIKCEQQSVCQLHLPHCEIRSTGGPDFLSVAHFHEEGIEFIGPHKITETHVIINITGFSGFGNVKDEDSPCDPVRALVLLFYKPPADPDPTSLLNVMLLPRNVAFRDVLRYRTKLDEDERYIETSPHCKLYPQQEYSLSTCPQDNSVLVEPTTAEFDSDNYDNYFPSFQVTLNTTMTHLKLFLKDTISSLSVWDRRVCLSSSGVQRSCGQSTLNLPPSQRLFDTRSSFIAGVSGPVLKSLLDKLLEKTVMMDSEVESVIEVRNRGDEARFVIDTVRKKGDAASLEMIKALRELDPFFSEHVGLM